MEKVEGQVWYQWGLLQSDRYHYPEPSYKDVLKARKLWREKGIRIVYGGYKK